MSPTKDEGEHIVYCVDSIGVCVRIGIGMTNSRTHDLC